MEIRAGLISFPKSRGSGPREATQTFNFNQSVRTAIAGISGTSFGFSPRDDHHLGRVTLQLETSIDDDVVTVTARFGVRDWSNDWDDNYEGNIQFMLLAELETSRLPSNISITGVEHIQTTQFFRSSKHLDPLNARPDNAIRLVERKDTTLRVYVDRQNDPNRPMIGQISGVAEIRIKGQAQWTPLLSPYPLYMDGKRDEEIDRAKIEDTLNFFIPAAFCTGDLEYRVKATDYMMPDVPGHFTPYTQGVLHFASAKPLTFRAVGVHYTGQGKDLAPPDMEDFRWVLYDTMQMHPVSDIFISGYQTMEFNDDFTAIGGDGCGDVWRHFLEKLTEVQGDHEEIFLALLPDDVDLGDNFTGCASGTVAGSRLNRSTVAHELAHTLGRDHAPGGDAPNPDANYPVYDAYPEGSIGEYGIDSTLMVYDPNTTFDIMSYAQPNWISPYTYEALQQRLLKTALIGPRGAGSQHLFLKLRIYRNGKVEYYPSFHYLSTPPRPQGKPTPYVIELRDRQDRVLQAQRVLLKDPHLCPDGAYLDVYQAIPFLGVATRIVITRDSCCEPHELSDVAISNDMPTVKIISPRSSGTLSQKVRVDWVPHPPMRKLTYILRYSNDGGTSWRNLTPAIQATEYEVDLDQLPSGEHCQFQVLATEGIRTGLAVSPTFTVKPHRRKTKIITPKENAVYQLGDLVILYGDSYSPDTGSAPAFELHWHSDRQGALGTGRALYLRHLEAGVHTITLTVPDGYGGQSTDTIRIEVQSSIIIL